MLKNERLATPPLLWQSDRTMPQENWNNQPEGGVRKGKYELFETTVLPYLNSAYNLARWLTQNEHDAEDIVQEAFLRALRSFDTFTVGRDARAWLLTIVRNCCRTWHRQKRSHETIVEWDVDSQPSLATWSDPEATLITNANSHLIRRAMEQLPFEYREILILRELEDLSYKEIALIVDVPLGTVMSRLSRARRELYAYLCQPTGEVGR
jgi:RNA polymerase sigma-70 factor (ECF subfamily)